MLLLWSVAELGWLELKESGGGAAQAVFAQQDFESFAPEWAETVVVSHLRSRRLRVEQRLGERCEGKKVLCWIRVLLRHWRLSPLSNLSKEVVSKSSPPPKQNSSNNNTLPRLHLLLLSTLR